MLTVTCSMDVQVLERKTVSNKLRDLAKVAKVDLAMLSADTCYNGSGAADVKRGTTSICVENDARLKGEKAEEKRTM